MFLSGKYPYLSSLAKSDWSFSDVDLENAKTAKCLVFYYRVSGGPAWHLSVIGRVEKNAFIFWNIDTSDSKI